MDKDMWFSGSVVQRIKGSGDDRIRIRIRERRGTLLFG
jgi:hypothetical protein